MGQNIFDWLLKALFWSRIVRQFVMAGNKDFSYVIIKREAMEKDISRVLAKMQLFALAQYGDTKYAFRSTLWAGKKGKCVLMFVPPNAYDAVKREEGCMGSIANIIRSMTKVRLEEGRQMRDERRATNKANKAQSK
jgi:hypothetical protein